MPDSTKRKHGRTGKPRGGKRPGAGRKKGSTSALPHGAVQAVKAMGYRVPEGAPSHLRQVADRAWVRIQDVMEGRVDFKAMQPVLKAATVLREEVCGPVTQKHEVGGPGGEPLVVEVQTYAPAAAVGIAITKPDEGE